MNKIEALIKKLEAAREELNKNMNCDPGSEPNMTKASANPALAPKEVKIKELQGKIDAGIYKPDSKKIADKMVKEEKPEQVEKELEHTMMSKDEALMMNEELTCSANGQWNLKKKHVGFKNMENKLEHEGHSKESAGNIAYAIGAKKYGKTGMSAKAHKSEDKED